MKVVQINTVPNGSTGKIMLDIHKQLLDEGYDSYVVWGRGRKPRNSREIYIGNKLSVYFHVLYSRLTGKTGFGSKCATKKLLRHLDIIKPDIVHLHNIHGYYINIELLFNYLKKNNIRVVWTLHDCWAFTGHCTHFQCVHCDKWQKQCKNCPQFDVYPKSFVDSSKWCYDKKKELFTGLNDLTIVTPSQWLANLVKKSFLSEYEIKVINNGVDTNIFKKIQNKEFRIKYHLEDKKILLGVAAPFTVKKGFNDFIKLASIIDDDCVIVLVGLNKKQIELLPNNIIGLERTANVNELVDIYNSSDIFLNLTYEDNYPMVNLEAIACGIPVITYDTGGSVEIVDFFENKNIDFIVKKSDALNDIDCLKTCIDMVLNNKININNRFLINKYDMFNKYFDIYLDRRN